MSYCIKSFHLKLKGSVYKSFVGTAIVNGSEASCLKDSDMGILKKTERSLLRAICGVHLKDRKGIMYLLLDLNESISSLLRSPSITDDNVFLFIIENIR